MEVIEMSGSSIDNSTGLWGYMNKVSYSQPFYTYSLFLVLAAISYYWFGKYVGEELVDHLLPWLQYIQENGRWLALGEEFHNYSGPYVSLLVLVSFFDYYLSNVEIIKILSVFGVFAASAVVWKIVKDDPDSETAPALAAGSFLFVPTVVANAPLWGQADIFHSSLLLLSLLFILNNRIAYSVIAFGLAFSFKFQAIFFGPLLLMFLLFERKNLIYLLIIPAMYFVGNSLLLILGRDFLEVSTIYILHSGYYDKLAINVPNPWFFVHGVLNDFPALHDLLYPYLIGLGLLLASGAGLAISSLGLNRPRPSRYQTLLLATFCVALMPYLLPKMHDRFFFAADVFSMILFFGRWRLWSIAVAFQMGSMLSYIPYFFNNVASKAVIVSGPLIGSFFVTYGIAVLGCLVVIEYGLMAPDRTAKLEALMAKLGVMPKPTAPLSA